MINHLTQSFSYCFSTNPKYVRSLATLALDNSVSACRTLISLLEDYPTEEIKMVAIWALQNFAMCSRIINRAIAEAGGISVVQEPLLSPNSDVVAQASLLIKFLYSNHMLQEYVSDELIRLLTAALEELWSTSTINEEVLRTINIIFANFYKLYISEATTLCIPPIWKRRSNLEVMLLKNLSWISYAG